MSQLRLDHLGFPSVDAAATHRFHTQVMGAPLRWAGRVDGALVTVYANAHGPTLIFRCGPDERGAPRLARMDRAHVGMTVSSAAVREAWKQRLQALGVTVTVDVTGPDERLYFADPNGIVFEIELARSHPTRPLADALAVVREWTAAQRQR